MSIELLAPAGDLEKLKIAVDYGADAVYFGGESFSLRAGAGNLNLNEMREGIAYAHGKGVKCYLTVNIYPHNEDIEPLEEFLRAVKDYEIDAFLVSDPGAMDVLKEIIPDAAIHLSTQANMTNLRTARFWKRQGVSRIVCARELTIKEICELTSGMKDEMEFECFVHGAMCISYSGRCLLSNFMAERDANRGMCAHPCRWKYALLEEQRPGEYYPIEEDKRGSYILNSRDLCMIEHIPELAKAGICSFKIEGRAKSIFYVATIVSAYRRAIDAYERDPEGYRFDPSWLEEVKKVSHREFTTGFFFDKPTNEDQNYQTSDYTRDYSFVGLIKDYDSESRFSLVEQRNKMLLGDEIEVFGPGTDFWTQKIELMIDAESGEELSSAPHPKQSVKIRLERPAGKNFMIRKRK